MDHTSRTAQWAQAILVFLVVSLATCLWGLGATDVVSMEGIVANGANDMERSSQYSVPHLYGQVYAYKPPMAYWMALASKTLFGKQTEWTLRLPFALSGVLLGFTVLLMIGAVGGPRLGLISALATVTGILFIQKVRTAEFDILLTAGVGIAVASACYNLAAESPHPVIWVIGYLGLTFGFLAKGAPAIITYFPGLIVAAFVMGRLRLLLSRGHLLSVALCVILILAWAFSAYKAAGWAAFEQPINEGRIRGLQWNLPAFALTLCKPLIIWALFLPWSILLPFVFLRNWRRRLGDKYHRLAIAAASFLACGIFAFMLLPTHHSRYYLPLSVSVGILCGLGVVENVARPMRLTAFRHRVLLLCSVLFALFAMTFSTGLLWITIQPTGRAWLLILALTTLVVVVCFAIRPQQKIAGAALLCAALCASAVHITAIQPHRAERRSLRSIASAFEPYLPAHATVWTEAEDSYSSLFFYLHRPVETLPKNLRHVPLDAYCILNANRISVLEQCGHARFQILHRASHQNDEFILAGIQQSE